MKSARQIIAGEVVQGSSADSIIAALEAGGYNIVQFERRRYSISPNFIVFRNGDTVTYRHTLLFSETAKW